MNRLVIVEAGDGAGDVLGRELGEVFKCPDRQFPHIFVTFRLAAIMSQD